MGNQVMKCCLGTTTVQVMRPNGRIDVYEFPIQASEVMDRYPQHLIIHSNFLDRDSFSEQGKKVTMLRPECPLLPGQVYILYPIPQEYRESVAQSLVKQSSSGDHSDMNSEEYQKKKASRRATLMAATKQHLATVLQSARDLKAGDQGCDATGGARQPLMERKRGDQDEEEYSFSFSTGWRPSLHSIPESPRPVPSDDRLFSRSLSFQ